MAEIANVFQLTDATMGMVVIEKTKTHNTFEILVIFAIYF